MGNRSRRVGYGGDGPPSPLPPNTACVLTPMPPGKWFAKQQLMPVIKRNARLRRALERHLRAAPVDLTKVVDTEPEPCYDSEPGND